MLRILESQAPAKQNATSTIATLSGRLQSATLLEDRRAAILGLRSFAKVYPASVASGGLRNLISCLNKDVDDVDTTKVVLETLLMLFHPDETSPEASDDIALWLADEFTQLISAILTARPERTQECVYTAPLGVARLVAILEDKREAIRGEGIYLLTSLTSSSPDLQKLVAFENAFDRVFGIIDGEGALTHGGIIVQDCLSLLANLLRLNTSNQSYFRETGWVKTLATLLGDATKEQDSAEGVVEWARTQRDKNIWGLLAVLRLFLLKGSLGTQANQVSFWHSGVLTQVLDIAFRDSFDVPIRAEALATAADLIRSNCSLQEAFGQQEVHDPHSRESPQANGHLERPPAPPTVNVISGLLNLALAPKSLFAFDVRLGACECLKAYLCGHTQIKQFFLRRAIDGHMSESKEADNILTILIEDSEASRGSDPYRQWFAAVILFHLLYEDFDAKNLAMGVSEGIADKGEEVVTYIQALSAALIVGEKKGEDQRVSIGYLVILCGWLYEDHDAVNDFLGEGSNLQSILQLVARNNQSRLLVSGLCAVLLGIVYEFSTKDSPVPRETIHHILTNRLGREQYADKITKLRENPMIREFEVLHRGYDPITGGLPEVFFDGTFIDFLKDNFSRVMGAIDRAPGIEVPVVANGIQKGVSRELVDSLRAQVDAGAQTIQKLESDLLTLERRLEQEQADHRKDKESASVELGRIRNINEALQRNNEEDNQKLLKQHQRTLTENQRTYEAALQSLQLDIQRARMDNETSAEHARKRNEGEVADLQATIIRLRTELEKSNKEHAQDLQIAHEEYTNKAAALEARLQRAEDKASDAEKRARLLQKQLEDKEEARRTSQRELDDMLMVLGDLEEKRARDKIRLKAQGEEVSDDEEVEDNKAEEEDNQVSEEDVGGNDIDVD
ncbi:MAG: hypothetical protein Q9163_001131 [Psora crenata]